MVLMIRWQVDAFAICSIDESAIESFCPLGDHTGFTPTPMYNLAHGASFRGRYIEPVGPDRPENARHPDGVHMVVETAAGCQPQQRQRLHHPFAILHRVVRVMAHDRRIAKEISRPVDLVSGAGIGNRGQKVDAQLGPLGDIQRIGNGIFVALAAIRGNVELRRAVANVPDDPVSLPRVRRHFPIAY